MLETGARHHICSWDVRMLAFLALLIGFAIKLPVVPLHTWLPDAHVEAPTPVSVVLAGILLKVGAYGILRCAYGIFPDGAIHFSWYIGFAGVISILYGGFNALAMADLKKMIAYSSVSHMGFVLLGIASLTSEGMNGSIFQMFSHGILSSLLFAIDYYRGLAIKMPVYTTVVTVAFFASLGLPGFSGFIGELFILLGAFDSFGVNGLLPRWMAIVSTLGILISAAYFLWTLQKMFFGKFSLSPNLKSDLVLDDLNVREKMMLVPLVFIAIGLGLFPGLLFGKISLSVSQFAAYVLDAGKGLH
jgi:NADH-quinone oxidoreductase subunit M